MIVSDQNLLSGHDVAVGDLGYRRGNFIQPNPPHEFEVIVCDLKSPACFDATQSGPGGNDNLNCTIVKDPKDQTIMHSGSSVPRIKIIQGQQIREVGHSNFDGHTVLNAVVRAGTHVFLIQNSEWARHVAWSLPNFIGLSWTVSRNLANKVSLLRPLQSLLSTKQTLPKVRSTAAIFNDTRDIEAGSVQRPDQ